MVADRHPADSAVLLAAASKLRTVLLRPLLSYELHNLKALESRLAAVLGEKPTARAREAGEKHTLEEALVEAEALLEQT